MDAKMYTQDEFFAGVNGRAQVRRMHDGDYARYRNAYRTAQYKRELGEPYYVDHNAGGVANKYGYTTTTARWGVWIDPVTRTIRQCADRPDIHSRHVPAVWPWGERAYMRAWREGKRTTCTLQQGL